MNEIANIFCSNYGQDEEIIRYVERKLNTKKESGYFKGCNNINIYYEKFIVQDEKGIIVISHGFTECLEKYTELIERYPPSYVILLSIINCSLYSDFSFIYSL